MNGYGRSVSEAFQIIGETLYGGDRIGLRNFRFGKLAGDDGLIRPGEDVAVGTVLENYQVLGFFDVSGGNEDVAQGRGDEVDDCRKGCCVAVSPGARSGG
ncbi:MAG: hypothetical protein H7840_14780, partial [Alphaproteobacteria bacterium]